MELHVWLPVETYNRYKESGMHASKVFLFGLQVAETNQMNRFLQEENDKLKRALDKWINVATEREKEIDRLRSLQRPIT